MTKVQAGGSSTVYGILYQMLWSLLNLLKIHVVSCSLDSQERIDRITMTLEPTGGGGDLQMVGLKERSIEQCKAKSDCGTWSLRKVIEEVLPDLYLAVDLKRQNTKYRFVTEGQIGKWQEVERFFACLGKKTCPEENVLSALDNDVILTFGGSIESKQYQKAANLEFQQEQYTERTLFECIAKQIRKRKGVRNEPVNETHKKLWHLLANFAFVGGQTEETLQKRVDSLLLALVDSEADLAARRGAMLDDLAHSASRGGATVKPKEFLERHGLNVVPLTDWNSLVLRSKHYLNNQLDLFNYNAEQNVRADEAEALVCSWPSDKPVLVLSGESGQGKSWQLFAIGECLTQRGELVTLVRAEGNASRDLEEAARVFSHELRDSDQILPLERLSARIHKLGLGAGPQLVTILIDGIQSPDEGILLAARPWERWQIRIVVSCLEETAEAINSEGDNRCQIVSIGDFSALQSQEYLSRRMGDRWPDIPSDLRNLLKRPLLASLYCDLAGDSDWCPKNEYQLYEKYWERLFAGQQASHPMDAVGFKKLASAVLKNSPYPWTGEQMLEAKLDNNAIHRLCRIGWLRRVPLGRYEIVHDRLLNWAVAHVLFESLEEKTIGRDDFCEMVTGIVAGQKETSGRYLGYAVMDLLRMLAQNDHQYGGILDQIFETLEGGLYLDRKAFYQHCVRFLGGDILPALFRRLEMLAEDDDWRASDVIDAITDRSINQVHEYAMKLLGHDSPLVKRVAMKVLTIRPTRKALDRLWELHCTIEREPAKFLREHEFSRAAYGDSFDALEACVKLDQNWLQRTIEIADPENQPVHSLGYLLASIDLNLALWQRCKPTLMKKVRPDKQRCLAQCIQRHRDHDETRWLQERVSIEDDLLGPACLHALGKLKPELAVQKMKALPGFSFYATRSWHFRTLLFACPDTARKEALALLKHKQNPWESAYFYQGYEDLADYETLECLLDGLEKLLDQVISCPPPSNRHPLWLPLEMLSRMYRLELIECFERRKGSALEKKLTSWLLNKGPRTSTLVDHELEYGFNVLFKIGGSGFTDVVNSWLDIDNKFGRYDGLKHAIKRPNPATIEKIIEVTRETGSWDDLWIQRQQAGLALASLGQKRELVKLIMRWGLQTSSLITHWHFGSDPFPDDVVKPAIEALSCSSEVPPGAVLAIGVGRRTDQADVVLNILKAAEPNSALAHACIITLGRLGSGSDEIVSVLQKCLRNSVHAYSTRLALLRIGGKKSSYVLLDHLESAFHPVVAMNLLQNPHTCQQAAALITNYLKSADPFNRSLCIRLLVRDVRDDQSLRLVLQDCGVRELLYESAFASEVSSLIVPKVSAISGLALLDRDKAFLAGKKALVDSQESDRHCYPLILMELDKHKAVELLLSQALRERSSRVLGSIGRVLAGTDVCDKCVEWLLSDDATKRLTACCLAMNLAPTAPLTKAVRERLSDDDDRVANAAWKALHCLNKAGEVDKLVAKISGEDNASRKWVLLDSVLSLGNPGDEDGPWPDWAQSVCSHLTDGMRYYLREQLAKRRKKLADTARREEAAHLR